LRDINSESASYREFSQNSEIETCNSDFMTRNCKFIFHNSEIEFLSLLLLHKIFECVAIILDSMPPNV